jgi:uncharacterized SAM-binding protein YcdF (DUF218 family)
MTARETFCALLDHGPLLESDAVVVLCGEDAEPRLTMAAHLLASRGSPIVVLTGGKDEPPRWTGAERAFPVLMGHGIAHDRIRVDKDAMNTREQAVNVVAMAKAEEWRRILLVASAYHSYRALLTFVKALQEAGATDDVQIVSAPVSHTPWGKAPNGMTETRLDLLAGEFEKIEEYADVASYEDGITYLLAWEGK